MTHPSVVNRSTCRRPAGVSAQRPSWRHHTVASLVLPAVWMIALTSRPVAFGFSQRTYSRLNPSLQYTQFISSSRGIAPKQYKDASCLQSRSSSRFSDVTTAIEGSPDDLTKQELLIQLSEVRNYYRENPEEKMSQADICLKLLCTRLANLRLNRCYVAMSTISEAGNGVFAGRDIPEGELITLYPGDAVLIHNPKEDAASPVVGVMFGSHVEGEARNTSRVTTHDARGYEMEINQYTSIVGDPSVGVSDKAYLGHFVNDGASLHEFDKASREIYSRATVAKCNAAHFVLEGAHMGTVATRAIKKGEEVFVSYEEGYWLSRSDSELTAEKEGVLVEVKAAMATSDPTESRHERRKNKKKKISSKGGSKNKGFGV